MILKLSPKTVEYHRARLMEPLKVRDIPGLVRFALQVGLVAREFCSPLRWSDGARAASVSPNSWLGCRAHDRIALHRATSSSR